MSTSALGSVVQKSVWNQSTKLVYGTLSKRDKMQDSQRYIEALGSVKAIVSSKWLQVDALHLLVGETSGRLLAG